MAPLTLPIQWLRSKIAGRRPGDGVMRAVLEGEPFLNQRDGVLCWLDAGGVLQTTALLGLAPLLSPALTGTPTAPLAALGDNSTTIANTGFVNRALAALVNGSPAQLDTLKELADALADDPNFAATMLAALAARLRVDAAQGLSAAQQAQGRANLAAQASLGFVPVQQGTGAGQQGNAVKIGYDGAGPRITIDNTDFGRVWTALQLTAAALNGIAGQALYGTSNLTAAQINVIAGQALYGTSNLTAAQINTIAGQVLYGTGNLNAGQIGAILGYAPARPTLTVSCSYGGLPDISTDREYVASVDFTATAGNFLGMANTSFQNSTSGSNPTFGYLACDLLDLGTGQAVGVSGVTGVSCLFGQGYTAAMAHFPVSGLTIGRGYRFRFFVSKSDGATQIPMNNAYATGINF